MENLDSLLDAHERRAAVAGDGNSATVAVKVPLETRDEFWSAAKELGVPRRVLAAAVFDYGMNRIRKRLKPPASKADAASKGQTQQASPSEAPPPNTSALSPESG